MRVNDSQRGPLLWLLLIGFVMRVMGQIVVVIKHPSWLPAMEQWYSGLLPYPILLPAQLNLIGIMTAIAYTVTRNGGVPPKPRPHLSKWLRLGSYLYAGVMGARYVIQVIIHPEWRWLGHTIPIFFHFVLAGFLLLLAGYYDDRSPQSNTSTA